MRAGRQADFRPLGPRPERELHRARLSVIGRNLGDDRHLVTESEIGDSQFYAAAPRRVVVQASMGF